MTQVRIPLPLYFEYEKKKVFSPELLQEVMDVDDYSIILNIGSDGARGIGKTTFLFEYLSLPKENYQYEPESTFSKNSVYVHTVFQTGGKKALLVDFNGSCKDFPVELKQVMDQCSLMIFHVA